MANFPVDVFFSDPNLTEDVTFSPDGVQQIPITVLFFAPYEQMTFGDITIQNAKPSMLVRDADIQLNGTRVAHKNVSFTRADGTVYYVDTIEPDETGVTRITLTKN